MSENGEIYTAGKNFTLPPALTAWTNSTSGQAFPGDVGAGAVEQARAEERDEGEQLQLLLSFVFFLLGMETTLTASIRKFSVIQSLIKSSVGRNMSLIL